MIAQQPATGVLINNSYGDAMRFTVACDCGCKNSDHDVWVEADAGIVSVEITTTQSTSHWDEPLRKRYDIDNEFLQHLDWAVKDVVNSFIRKIKLTADVWLYGSVKYTAAIIMNEQQTLNYAATLEAAVAETQNFKKQSKMGTTTK